MIKTQVIFNPAAAAGRTGRNRPAILAALERALGPSFAFYETKRPLDATAAATAWPSAPRAARSSSMCATSATAAWRSSR